MINLQVWAEPLCRRHYASSFSFAFFLRVGVHLGMIALSLVIPFATGGFWVKVKPTLDQPEVHYTNDALLVFEVGGSCAPCTEEMHAK
jgi:transmembrane protein 231